MAFENASIAWSADDESDERFALRDVTLVFPRGELSVISGKTGSGKSLLLSAIIGEADLLSGTIRVPTAPCALERHDHKAHRGNWVIPSLKAYVAQTPWIENASLRDNVLSGLPLDEERYSAAIETCALRKDLEVLADGDGTELGANGVNLSGGQKWRVTLARAVYSRAGILVLDDVFSAVDAHVGRHILERCLAGPLCRGRTRILVTHHVALCRPRARFLVELGDGGVKSAGVLENQDEGLLGWMETRGEGESGQVAGSQTDTDVDAHEHETALGDGSGKGESLPKAGPKVPRRFIEEEAREKGAVKAHVYRAYFNSSGGHLPWASALLLWAVYQSCIVGEFPAHPPCVSFFLTNSRARILAQNMDRLRGDCPQPPRNNPPDP
ncbi:ATP-binding cassette domain-containing protein [Candidatus Bathyarchaeota archaeon]|nr:ATP-binding cassette domain-containing protein [Candidatus Bathyarchaeota archaeon]